MNLVQLAESLPNGLHDAELTRLTLDYAARTAALDLELRVATETSPRELYRPARITLVRFDYFVIEPPDAKYRFRDPEAIRIDLSPDPEAVVPNCAEGAAFRLFVSDWNAFVRAASPEAELQWLGPGTIRGG